MVTNVTADLALSVHGPVGVLDLVVPAGASAVDVAAEYARQAGLRSVPVLCNRVGAVLPPDAPLPRAGVRTGDVLVATTEVVPAAGRGGPSADPAEPTGPGERGSPAASAGSVVAAIAAGCALAAGAVAGWVAEGSTAGTGDDRLRLAVILVLALGALLGAIPVGRSAAARAAAAPAFAGSAALVVVWDPDPARLPMVLGLSALVAAVAAASVRSLTRVADEALQVWIVAGVAVFGLTALATLAGAPPRLTWSVLLVLAVLAARVVPGMVVDVPDQYLIDLERLAVTAWSARERPTGKRGRSVVPWAAVRVVAGQGARLLTASSAAVAAVVLVAGPLLLMTATLRIDRVGARLLVALAGAALLLAARSYRHRGARALLRTAGLGAWVALLVGWLPQLGERALLTLSFGSIGVGALLVVVAVATGRGWRSAWWSRRAEVAEAWCGALVVASLVVSSGWFRKVWEMASLWELGK